MNRFLRMTAVVLAAAFAFLPDGLRRQLRHRQLYLVCGQYPRKSGPAGSLRCVGCHRLRESVRHAVAARPDGELVPGLCEKWTVSPDGLTYTFTLKDGLTYAATKGAATEYDITAEDFVFAFRRIFRADTASPYAVEFSAIQNSAAVLAGLRTKAVWAFRPMGR